MNSFSQLWSNFSQFDNHRMILRIEDKKIGLSGYIAIHRGGIKRAAFGATRMWPYESEKQIVIDVLKLSKIMTYKVAMAGLPYGGAKAVLQFNRQSGSRLAVLSRYAEIVDIFNGRFITGADVGINTADLHLMLKKTKHMVGTQSDPVWYTGMGVYSGIQVCLKEVFGSEDTTGRSFAIQGLGKTGTSILSNVYKTAGAIYVSDINKDAVKKIHELYPKVKVVPFTAIASQEVDVFCPCALSDAINENNIDKFRCRIIAGSANAQLESDLLGDQLYKKEILYAPDYVINAGGLIAVADEYENKKSDKDRVKKKVIGIKNTLRTIFRLSKQKHLPASRVSDMLAEDKFKKVQ